MNIVLGIYANPHFQKMVEQPNNSSYPFYELIGDDWTRFHSIADTVCFAAAKAEKIFFHIDEIIPFKDEEDFICSGSNSVTCLELYKLLIHPRLWLKIQFFQAGLPITNDEAISILNIPSDYII